MPAKIRRKNRNQFEIDRAVMWICAREAQKITAKWNSEWIPIRLICIDCDEWNCTALPFANNLFFWSTWCSYTFFLYAIYADVLFTILTDFVQLHWNNCRNSVHWTEHNTNKNHKTSNKNQSYEISFVIHTSS